MMLDIEPLVRRMAPAVLSRRPASVACIATTRRKYLVFDSGLKTHPRCVVEYGDPERLLRTAHVLRTLSARLPGIVPAVVACAPADDGHGYVLIQEGLPGMPWFRVSDGMKTKDAWNTLVDRTLDAMKALHGAIKTEPSWIGVFDLGYELDRQAAYAVQTNISLPAPALALVHEWRSKDALLPSFCQHGDYSLNNLLVGPKGIAIIDFDEFGATMAPLHDAIGLALSFALSQGGPLDRDALIADCVARSQERVALREEHVPALLLHHLLLRINQCYGLYRRARLRATLLRLVDELVR